jgi:hypothetical protein
LIAENKPSVVTATNISQAFWAGLCRWTSLPKTVCRPWVNALTGIANLVTKATWRALATAPVIAANLAIALRGANAQGYRVTFHDGIFIIACHLHKVIAWVQMDRNHGIKIIPTLVIIFCQLIPLSIEQHKLRIAAGRTSCLDSNSRCTCQCEPQCINISRRANRVVLAFSQTDHDRLRKVVIRLIRIRIAELFALPLLIAPLVCSALTARAAAPIVPANLPCAVRRATLKAKGVCSYLVIIVVLLDFDVINACREVWLFYQGKSPVSTIVVSSHLLECAVIEG